MTEQHNTEPARQPVDDRAAVAALLAAVRNLTNTRDEVGIRELFEQALTAAYGVAG
jgi:hypothetical protein